MVSLKDLVFALSLELSIFSRKAFLIKDIRYTRLLVFLELSSARGLGVSMLKTLPVPSLSGEHFSLTFHSGRYPWDRSQFG